MQKDTPLSRCQTQDRLENSLKRQTGRRAGRERWVKKSWIRAYREGRCSEERLHQALKGLWVARVGDPFQATGIIKSLLDIRG